MGEPNINETIWVFFKWQKKNQCRKLIYILSCFQNTIVHIGFNLGIIVDILTSQNFIEPT